MPFSRQNIRFTSLLIGVVVLASVIAGSAVALSRSETLSPVQMVYLISSPAIVLMQFVAMLRVEHTRVDVRHDVRNELGPVSGNVEYIAKKLENGGKPLQVSRDELRNLITEIVQDVCKVNHDEIHAMAKKVSGEVLQDMLNEYRRKGTP